MQIKAVNAVPSYRITHNIVTNLDNHGEWINQSYKPHNRKALLVGAGYSAKKHIGKIRQAQKEGYDVYTIKHALPILRDGGIVPKGMITLDPRPAQGTSTHGIKRADLFDDLPKETVVFLASMTHPSVFEYIKNRGNRVIGFHAYMEETKMLPEYYKREWGVETPPIAVGGGTCSANRSIPLLEICGYRHIEMVGMDYAYLPEDPSFDIKKKAQEDPKAQVQLDQKGNLVAIVNQNGSPKYLQMTIDGQTFWTSGEMAAGFQDLEQMFSSGIRPDMTIFPWEDCGPVSILYKKVHRGEAPSSDTLFSAPQLKSVANG